MTTVSSASPALKENDLKNRLSVEQKRLEISKAGIKSQLAPQEADIAQRKAAADLAARRLEGKPPRTTE